MSDAFVILRSEHMAWAVDARLVREIRPIDAWTTTAFDVGQLWGAPTSDPTRAVVIDDAFALVAARLGFRAIARERLLPLPPEWASARAKGFVEGIIFEDEGQPLVVLDLEGLRHGHHE